MTLFWLVLFSTARMRHELMLVGCIPAVFVAIVLGFSMGIYAADTWGVMLALPPPVLAWFGARALARRYHSHDLLIAIYLSWAAALVFALIATGFPDRE